MKFFGRGVVWNPDKNCALMEFDKNGEYETEDDKIIERLTELNFKNEQQKVEEFILKNNMEIEKIIKKVRSK